MSKVALVVGINYYQKQNNLEGCINDAQNISKQLEYNEDGSSNFEVIKMCGIDESRPVNTKNLIKNIKDLFSNRHNDTVLLYFSGHGGLTLENGGYIATSDTGISMADIIEIVNESPVNNKIIIMDACHSGYMGNHPSYSRSGSCIGEGVTILTASSDDQVSLEDPLNKQGVFTKLLIDALSGGASNILGQITPGSLYAHVDKALGNFGQRPIFKTNTNRFIQIRNVSPLVNIMELRRLSTIFNSPHLEYKLDQSYEVDTNVPPEYSNKEPCNAANNEIFRILQNLNRVGLIVPVGVKDMYFAAMDETSCQLTPLGKFYWELSYKKRIM